MIIIIFFIVLFISRGKEHNSNHSAECRLHELGCGWERENDCISIVLFVRRMK